ncbi:MAG: hypothetical protein L0G99_09660, partial [Propionibacteriales bacterium]|nr:hypothetical protein [Propionibacteriales bacterium]
LVADEALARGERGPMSSTVDVLQYLSAYAKGPDAYAEFSASLVPTHRWQVVSDSGGSSSTDLARAHHPGRFAYDLSSLNGVDPWAVVLTAHPPNETSHEHSTMSYLQAAGTADALVIEFCGPAPAGPESASVRSVVGRQGDGMPDAPAGPFEVEIPLPRSKERVGPHEVFTADEAAKLFEAFYRTDKVADGYRLRPVERYLDHP